MTDGLTGLRNRTYLDQRLASEVSSARRGDRPLSCIMADLDHFKRINDEHGHPFGDEVLRGAGKVFQLAMRAEDLLCRYGGEEFTVLLPGTPLDAACAVAERMREALNAIPFARNGNAVAVTGSFGVAALSPEPDPQDLLRRTDRALYRAKATGRNVVVAADAVAEALTATT